MNNGQFCHLRFTRRGLLRRIPVNERHLFKWKQGNVLGVQDDRARNRVASPDQRHRKRTGCIDPHVATCNEDVLLGKKYYAFRTGWTERNAGWHSAWACMGGIDHPLRPTAPSLDFEIVGARALVYVPLGRNRMAIIHLSSAKLLSPN